MDQEKIVRVEQAGGQLKIAEDVIATIVSLALVDQEGIDKTTKKNKHKGIAIRMEEGKVVCDVEISIVQGTKIPEMVPEAQEKIKTAVETMTGLEVKQVNVYIVSMNMEKTVKEA